MSKFVHKGAIQRIYLENFVTYTKVEAFPGPGLNVIIGPNASGKSTLVCAICLGLAGNPRLLSRGLTIPEYIKHDASQAVVEIDLCNPGGKPNRIRREMSRDGSSRWLLDNRSVTQKQIEAFVADLGIQLNNLTQFLPQERVSDFVRMSPQEILENTERAVSPQLYADHQHLKTAAEKMRRYENEIALVTEKLASERKINGQLEQDVQSFEARQKYVDELKKFKIKRPWLAYNEQLARYQSAKALREARVAELKTAEQAQAPRKAELATASKAVQALANQIKTHSASAENHFSLASNVKRTIDDSKTKIEDLQSEYKRRQAEESDRRRKVNDLKARLNAEENELKNTAENVNIQPEIDRVNNQLRSVSSDMTCMLQDADTIRREVSILKREQADINNSLQKLQDMNSQRLQALKRFHKDTYDAVMWLRSNRNMFRGVVHEPMMLTIQMKNPDDAKYLENTISGNDMRAFIFEDNDDLRQFDEIMRSELKLKVNVLNVLKDCTADSFQPQFPIEHYQPAKFLSSFCSADQERQLREQIQDKVRAVTAKENELNKVTAQLKDLEKQEEELRSEKKRLSDEMSRRRTLMQKIQTTKQHIQRCESLAIDLNEEKKKMQEGIKIVMKNKEQLLAELRRHTANYSASCMEKTKLSIRQAVAMYKVSLIEANMRNLDSQIATLVDAVKQANTEAKTMHDQAAKLLDEAKKASSLTANQELPEHLKKLLEDLPQSTLEEIDEEIHRLQTSINCITQVDSEVIRDFENRKVRIEELEKTVEECNQKAEQHRAMTDVVKQRWLDPLRDVIRQISDKFSAFFASLNCAGDVELSIPQNPENYNMYGIAIRVKFRDTEELCKLTPFQQSGGERAVSTALYMLSLQEMTRCPFRCIDEINQGMDPQNERAVFDLVVQTACDEKTSQYFLFTPKLLTGLMYSERLTVLVVFNGKQSTFGGRWSLEKFASRRRALPV